MKKITKEEFKKFEINESGVITMYTDIYSYGGNENLNIFMDFHLQSKLIYLKLVRLRNLVIKAVPSALYEIILDNNKIGMLDHFDGNYLSCEFDDIELYEVSNEEIYEILSDHSKKILTKSYL